MALQGPGITRSPMKGGHICCSPKKVGINTRVCLILGHGLLSKFVFSPQIFHLHKASVHKLHLYDSKCSITEEDSPFLQSQLFLIHMAGTIAVIKAQVFCGELNQNRSLDFFIVYNF